MKSISEEKSKNVLSKKTYFLELSLVIIIFIMILLIIKIAI
jgi:hypothetical protein